MSVKRLILATRIAALLLLVLIFFMTVSPAMAQFATRPDSGTAPSGDLANSVRGCLYGSLQVQPVSARVAFLVPTFTLTPYSNFGHSFYAFYAKYQHANGKITHDLNWLSTRVSANWSAPEVNDEKPLNDFLTSTAASRCGLLPGKNLQFTDDVAVDGGALFAKGVRQFDVLILGHEEYVTKAEYAQLKAFAASGGRLVAISGNTFWAEVNYTRSTGMETFVIGHGFGYNGVYAWRTGYAPFDQDAAGWFASTFAGGLYNLRGAILETSSEIGRGIAATSHSTTAFTSYSYPHDEVNYLRNLTDTSIIARFYMYTYLDGGKRVYFMPPVPVDSYVHQYRRGEVVCFCAFGQNLILHDPAVQFFLIYAVERGFTSARDE